MRMGGGFGRRPSNAAKMALAGGSGPGWRARYIGETRRIGRERGRDAKENAETAENSRDGS